MAVKEPTLVSINIPTFNSAATLRGTLLSIQAQSYSPLEIVVIDGCSTDRTAEIASEFRAQIIVTPAALLEARIRGILSSRGKYTLLLDSDQVLKPGSLDRLVRAMDAYDMVCLGEDSATPSLLVPRLIEMSRAIVQSDLRRYMNPYSGLIIPRFFESKLLKNAVQSIPSAVRTFVSDRDHQILFYETYQLSDRLGFLPDCVSHADPKTLSELIRKSARWGEGAGRLYASGYYRELIERRYAARLSRRSKDAQGSSLGRHLGANLLAIVKGVPYEIGFQRGKRLAPEKAASRAVG